MATICPYCNIEVNESAIEAEDGCCPECGSIISASSSFLGEEPAEFDDSSDFYDDFEEEEEDDVFDRGNFSGDFDDEDLDEEFEEEDGFEEEDEDDF